MDLPYPSYRKSENGEQSVLHSMNKKLRSTIWSMNDLGKHQQNLSQNIRNSLVKTIQKNDVNRLMSQVDKGSINFETEIGTKGSKWSFIHFCARWNAVTCLEMILKNKYRQNPNQFLFFINAKTSQGYTPLMIAVIYQSNLFLEEFLDYGGIDIFLVDNNKVTAYQMAITQSNQKAINQLVQYQRQNKITTFLNTYKLSQKFTPPDPERKCSICRNLWNWLFKQTINKDIVDSLPDSTTKRGLTKQLFIDNEFPAIASSVCNDIESVMEQNIEWFRINDLLSGKQLPLFDTFSAYQIKQLNFTIKHSLSIFQSIVQYPWIIRSKIKKSVKEGMYHCLLFPNGVEQEMVIDDLIPCLKSTKQPMFFSNNKQIWPILLQKAWVKIRKNYTLARDISPKIIFQQLLGFHSQTFKVQEHKQNLFNQFKAFSKKGYLIVLTAKQESSLKQDNFGPESFGVFSLTEKDNKQYFLVNCPFILPQWKQKQKSQNLALRLIRSHYNSTSQMAVWMQFQQILTHFQSFTICYGDPSLIRTQLKVRVKQCLFFKYECNKNINPQKFLFKIFKSKGQYKEVPIKSIEIGRDDSIDNSSVLTHQESFGKINSVEISEGSFLCKIELLEQNIDCVLVGYSSYQIDVDVFDEQFGKIEWVYMLRDQIAEKIQQSSQPTFETFHNYILIIQKTKKQQPISIEFDFQKVQYVVQGHRQTNCILLEKCENYYYGILKMKDAPQVRKSVE